MGFCRVIGIAMVAWIMTATGRGRAQGAVAGFRDQGYLRVLHDSATGNTWILKRDPVHPGSPGLMVQVRGAESSRRIDAGKRAIEPNVIHAGDRVEIEEGTDVVHAELEAVALGNAQMEHPLLVRVVIGGRIARAIATKPGRVRWEGEWTK